MTVCRSSNDKNDTLSNEGDDEEMELNKWIQKDSQVNMVRV